ncbi:MAG TPA: class A beta-lactamase [Bryobacteraceae bacterium]|nr:class A beta-lactamase [Bryobacteraceae bacterium]
MKRVFLLMTVAALTVCAADPPSTPGFERLQSEVARLATISDGEVGLSALHVESGRRVALHSTDRFPMASTFKVPVAVQLLARVDRGEISLDQMIRIEPHDLHPGSGTLNNLFNKPGVELSVRNIMELMLLISDNSAADISLRLAGGGEAVTAKMRELGIEGINVNRSTAYLIADWRGATLPPEQDWTPEAFRAANRAVTPEQRAAANDRFNHDPRDTSQPDAMEALLEKIYARNILKPESADLLLDIMSRCQTGAARIKGILPPQTPVAHKTGSLGGAIDDVGIITLPDNAGHVIVALFIKQGSQEEVSERTIAQISRAIYDYFLFTPQGGE